jgi:2-aminoethylphosphonate dioxygenase
LSYKEEYAAKGFFSVPNFISSDETSCLKKAIEEVKGHPDVDVYYDRSNLARRLEYFVFKHEAFQQVNEKIKSFLLNVTSKEQSLFKDKVNFKPPSGEGFFAHYDGIFEWSHKDGIIKHGWYEYATTFNNALITLDDFTTENGTLELADSRYDNFKKLLADTEGDGSPFLRVEIVQELDFTPIIVPKGSLIIFKHTCAHQSSPNRSLYERGSLYLTYTNLEEGEFYEQYFADKHQSMSTSKSLIGEEA